MKKKHSFSLVLLLTVVLSSAAIARDAVIYKVYKLTPEKILNIRKFPTTHSRNIGKLSYNSRWLIKQKGRKVYRHSTWQKISWKGTRGWVKAKYLTLDIEAINKAQKNPDCILRTKHC